MSSTPVVTPMYVPSVCVRDVVLTDFFVLLTLGPLCVPALAVDRGGTVSSSSIALCLPPWGMPALLECLFLVHTTRDLAPSRLSLRRRPRLVSLIVRVNHLPPPLQPFFLFFPLKWLQQRAVSAMWACMCGGWFADAICCVVLCWRLQLGLRSSWLC